MAIRSIYKKFNLIMSYYHFLKKLCSDLSISFINCIYLVGCFFIIIASSIFTKSLLIFVLYGILVAFLFWMLFLGVLSHRGLKIIYLTLLGYITLVSVLLAYGVRLEIQITLSIVGMITILMLCLSSDYARSLCILAYKDPFPKLKDRLILSYILCFGSCVFGVGLRIYMSYWVNIGNSPMELGFYIFAMYVFVVAPLLLTFQIGVSISSRKISLFKKNHDLPIFKEDLIGFVIYWMAEPLVRRYIIFFILVSLYRIGNWGLAIVVNLFLTTLVFFTFLPGVRVHITTKYGPHALRLLGYNATYKAIITIVEAAVPPLILGGFGLA